MKKATAWGALALFCLASNAAAQDAEEPTSPPEPAVTEGTEVTATEEPASEGSESTPAASPEVQRQVGMGTEKESTTTPPQDTAPDAPDDEPQQSKEEGEEDTYGHALQFGLRAGLVAGFKIVFRYEDSPFCQKPKPAEQPTVDEPDTCGFASPLATEVALSFGVIDSLEPYIWGRFGLSGESQTNTEALKIFGVGTRIYTMSDSRFKLFVEPAIGLEVEKGAGNSIYNPADLDPQYKNDIIFHLGIGPQYDIAKAIGIYLNAGLDVGILRQIHSTMLGNVGVQVRVP